MQEKLEKALLTWPNLITAAHKVENTVTFKVTTYYFRFHVNMDVYIQCGLKGLFTITRFHCIIWISFIIGSPHVFINFFTYFFHEIECCSLTVHKNSGICYQNCSDLLWEKSVLVIEKNVWNSRLKAKNLPNFWYM